MESIILLILFAVIPSIIKNMLKTDEKHKQKQTMNQPRINQTRVHQGAKKSNRQDGLNSSAAVSRKTAFVQDEVLNTANTGMEQKLEMENVQTEGLPPQGAGAIEPQTEDYNAGSQFFPGDITLDELQRSIVMAEILGKPKALRK